MLQRQYVLIDVYRLAQSKFRWKGTVASGWLSNAPGSAQAMLGVMFHREHVGALAADPLDQLAEPLDLVRRKARRRFVKQQEGGFQHQRAGDLDEAQLAVPIRKLPRWKARAGEAW